MVTKLKKSSHTLPIDTLHQLIKLLSSFNDTLFNSHLGYLIRAFDSSNSKHKIMCAFLHLQVMRNLVSMN